jgi:hypothetical protein
MKVSLPTLMKMLLQSQMQKYAASNSVLILNNDSDTDSDESNIDVPTSIYKTVNNNIEDTNDDCNDDCNSVGLLHTLLANPLLESQKKTSITMIQRKKKMKVNSSKDAST